MVNKKQRFAIGLVLVIVIVVLLASTDFGCDEPGWFEPDEAMAERIFGKEKAENAYDIERAEDHVAKFEIAKDVYEHEDARFEAHMAASCYLDAHDLVNYSKWKDIERSVEAYIEKHK